MNQPSVAIVILNWNGKNFLARFLPSVLATKYKNFKLVVADNASTDDSLLFLKKNYPEVELVILDENYGFAGGYNQALQNIYADYYLLLNSDVEVDPGWLEPMVMLLERESFHVACQPKILAYYNKHQFEYAGAAGGWMDRYGYPFARGRVFDFCEEDKGQYNTTEEVFWASGAAMLVKSSYFDRLGGFDEYFFAHQEEIDLCWRIQLDGGKIFCCPESIVYHVGGGTLARGNSRKTYLNFRNNLIMLEKNLVFSEKWWKIPYRLLLDIVSAIKGLLSGSPGYFFAIWKAHLAFFYWVMFHKKNDGKAPKKKLDSMKGVFRGNVVWEHFAKRRKTFSEIKSIRAESSKTS